jgi:predicted dehydrogenase
MTFSAEPPVAAVIDFGSIGARYANVLAADGWRVQVVSRRSGPAEAAGYDRVASIDALLARPHPAYLAVANETTAHLASVRDLAASEYPGRVLLEKPLFDAPADLPAHKFAALGVGYNLRFRAAVQTARAAIGGRLPNASRPASASTCPTGGRAGTTARPRRRSARGGAACCAT